MPSKILRRFLSLPIRTKLTLILGILIADMAALIAASAIGLAALSALRAYVGGEGLWAKAQKNATISLGRYARVHDEADFRAFQDFLSVPLGDRKARLALQAKPPDLAAAREGFLEGENDEDDVPGLIRLFLWAREVPQMKRAIAIWTKGDELIAELQAAAEDERLAVRRNRPRDEAAAMVRATEINARMTVLENEFSYALGDASRWAKRVLLRFMLGGSLALGGLGVLIALVLTHALTKSVRDLADAAERATRGDLTARILVGAEDELGRLARSFNRMEDALADKTRELQRSNEELESFAFTAAHDLQEPLRKIAGFSRILEERREGVDSEMRETMDRIIGATRRMQDLIEALLRYSRVGRGEQPQPTPAREAFDRAVANLETAIRDAGAEVAAGDLPTVTAGATQLEQLFQNLIGNALKFRAAGRPPLVRVDAERRGAEWEFAVRDNGIGFEAKYAERIFGVFERLHSRAEYPGTGIGLAICRKIVERHGGRIWAESEPGKGAAFRFTLPA